MESLICLKDTAFLGVFADRQTDMTKPVVAIRNVTNAPEIVYTEFFESLSHCFKSYLLHGAESFLKI